MWGKALALQLKWQLRGCVITQFVIASTHFTFVIASQRRSNLILFVYDYKFPPLLKAIEGEKGRRRQNATFFGQAEKCCILGLKEIILRERVRVRDGGFRGSPLMYLESLEFSLSPNLCK